MINELSNRYSKLLPGVSFVASKNFYWSPKDRVIHFEQDQLASETGQWALLHEVSHALLGHDGYASDFQLLTLEVAAWEEAQKIAQKQNIAIDLDHIQDCLDTYRDWLYARSTCPTCRLNSLQVDETTYSCPNCRSKWSVSRSRFCRPYRMTQKHTKTPSRMP